MPRGSHGGGEHPRGQEHREGDPAGAAPAGKKGDEAGTVVGAGEPLREPPHSMQQRGPRGVGSRSWQSSRRWLSHGMLSAGARLGGGNMPVQQACAHSPGDVGSSLWNHPCDPLRDPASGTIPTQQARACSPRMECRMQTSPCRVGQGGNLGQEEERAAGEGSWLSPGTVAAAGAAGWEPGERSPLLRANTGRDGGAVSPAKKERPWGGRELCPRPRDGTGATSTGWTSCPHAQH